MVYGYIRVSSDKQMEKTSPGSQLKAIREFAESIGDQYRIYEEAQSGKSLDARLEFQRLLEDIQRDSYPNKKVWAVEITRIARNISDADSIRKIFQKHKVQLYVNGTLHDLTIAGTRLVYGIQSAVSAHERELIGERIQRAKKYAADQGTFINSALLGYTCKYYENGGGTYWVIDEEEARIVRKIFDDYLDGVSVNRIATELNRLGFKTKRGHSFAATTVAKLLNHPYYFGECYDSEGNILKSKVYMPLLPYTKEEFHAERDRRKPKADKFKAVRKDVTGIIRCKSCGAPYYIHRKGGKQGKYTYLHHYESAKTPKCNQIPKYIGLDATAKLLESFYENSILDPRFLKMLIMKEQFDRPTIKSIEEEASWLDKEIATCDERKGKLLLAVEEGAFTLDDIKERVRALNLEIERIKVLRAQAIDKMKDFYLGTTPSSDEANRRIEVFRDSDAQARHRALLYIIMACKIDGDTVTLVRCDRRTFQWKVNQEDQFAMATVPMYIPMTLQERHRTPTHPLNHEPLSAEEAWTIAGIDLTYQGHLLTGNDS